jgi:TonB family protein
VGLFFAPKAKDVTPPVVMTITLSGSEGPRTEGMSEAASRTVQEVKPAETAKPIAMPPAPAKPEMTLPDSKSKPRSVVKPKDAPLDATSRTLNTGEQVKSGTAPAAPTQIRGQGFGLTTSGGAGLGSKLQVDATNFCCPEYLEQMVAAIKTKWNQSQALTGTVTMKFTIQKNGTLTEIQVERPSFDVLNNESLHALQTTAKIPPLPAQYPNSTLTVHLAFEYVR